MPTNLLLEPKHFWRYNFIWVIWLLVISYLSNKHPSGLPEIAFFQFKGADKLVHGIFYFILTALMLWGFENQSKFIGLIQNKFIIVLVFAFLWGGLMELSQLLVFTYRSAEWKDQFANCLGALLSAGLFRIFINRKPI